VDLLFEYISWATAYVSRRSGGYQSGFELRHRGWYDVVANARMAQLILLRERSALCGSACG